MARPKNVYPTYRHHKPTNTARCWVNGEWVNLGKYNSAKSHREFNRIHAQCSLGTRPVKPRDQQDYTISEVILGYVRFASHYYRRPDGTQTNEYDEIERSLAMLRKNYDDCVASEFGPDDLEAVREQMIAADWCRKLINKRIGRIRRCFKWAEKKRFVKGGTYGALRLVNGLKEAAPLPASRRRSSPPIPSTSPRPPPLSPGIHARWWSFSGARECGRGKSAP